jgi:hypothetical protein
LQESDHAIDRYRLLAEQWHIVGDYSPVKSELHHSATWVHAYICLRRAAFVELEPSRNSRPRRSRERASSMDVHETQKYLPQAPPVGP